MLTFDRLSIVEVSFEEITLFSLTLAQLGRFGFVNFAGRTRVAKTFAGCLWLVQS